MIAHFSAGSPAQRAGLRSALASWRDRPGVKVHDVERIEEVRAISRESGVSGGERIVVAGGNDTLHAALVGLIEAGVPPSERPVFGLVPTGRDNSLAKALGLPREIAPALALAVSAEKTRWMDAGQATIDDSLHWFFTSLGFGMGALVARRLRWLPFSGLGAYLPVAALTILDAETPWLVRGAIDGTVIDRGITMLSILNGPYGGGAVHFCPEALLDDGRLDYFLGAAAGRIAILRLLPRVLRGKHSPHPLIERGSFTRMELRFDPPIPAQIDSAPLSEPALKAELRCLPREFRVAVP